MAILKIFDPAMCCTSGVCGPMPEAMIPNVHDISIADGVKNNWIRMLASPLPTILI